MGIRPQLLVAAVLALPHAALAVPPAGGEVHALLINGGEEPESNYLSHLHHLQDMMAVLQRRGVEPGRIHVFSADGQEPAPDLATRGAAPDAFWLLEDTAFGDRLRPTRLVDTQWQGVTLQPARLDRLRGWFRSAAARLLPGDRLLVFVTDHGTGGEGDPEEAAISLWRERLTVRELRALLDGLPPDVPVLMIMSQCYSGAFANVMGAGGGLPAGGRCGFFSTTPEREAYGCYPEGRDRDRVGHAFHFIEAMGRRATLAEAHRDVLAADDSPDVPLRTSDAYLARIVAEEAVARATDEDEMVDSLLAEAWRAPAAWETESRLLDAVAAAFGTTSPRRLAEVESRRGELEALARPLETFTDRWETAFEEMKEDLLLDFLRGEPGWHARLEPAAWESRSEHDRAALLDELLPALVAHARRSAFWPRLGAFRDRAARAAQAQWRLEVRQAALLRMRTILMSMAGRVLLARRGPGGGRAREARRARQALALERLQACEASILGPAPAQGSTGEAPRAAPFPSWSDDAALIRELAPSWLGVRLRPVDASVREERGWPAGASVLEAIYPDSPALEAGLQPGDVVVGRPEQPFESPRELREWAMASPRGVPLALAVVRPGGPGQQDRLMEKVLVLRATPALLPTVEVPSEAGERRPRP